VKLDEGILTSIARRAALFPDGSHDILVIPDCPNLTEKCRVYKDSKMVVIVYPFLERNWEIVAFPCKKNDRKLFKQNSEKMAENEKYGISQTIQNNPEAVGSLILGNIPDQDILYLITAQAHYQGNKYLITRNIATYYNGWRYRCLKAAIILSHELGLKFVVPSVDVLHRPGSHQKLLEEMHKAVREVEVLKIS
jgi:hypothetical protein